MDSETKKNYNLPPTNQGYGRSEDKLYQALGHLKKNSRLNC